MTNEKNVPPTFADGLAASPAAEGDRAAVRRLIARLVESGVLLAEDSLGRLRMANGLAAVSIAPDEPSLRVEPVALEPHSERSVVDLGRRLTAVLGEEGVSTFRAEEVAAIDPSWPDFVLPFREVRAHAEGLLEAFLTWGERWSREAAHAETLDDARLYLPRPLLAWIDAEVLRRRRCLAESLCTRSDVVRELLERAAGSREEGARR